MINITKRQIRTALGEDARDVDVARLFDVTPAAVSLWPEDGPIPERRNLWLIVNRPDLAEVVSRGAANDDAPPAEGNGAGGEGG